MTTPLRVTVEVTEDGEMMLPAEIRSALGLTGAGQVILARDEDGIRITTRDQIVKRVQALAAPYLRGAGSMADERIAECRAEAAREDAEDAAERARQRPGLDLAGAGKPGDAGGGAGERDHPTRDVARRPGEHACGLDQAGVGQAAGEGSGGDQGAGLATRPAWSWPPSVRVTVPALSRGPARA